MRGLTLQCIRHMETTIGHYQRHLITLEKVLRQSHSPSEVLAVTRELERTARRVAGVLDRLAQAQRRLFPQV